RLQVKNQGPLEVRCDSARLRQVFFNLIDNAIKYTPEEGMIQIRVERSNAVARVIVKDSGIGIPPEHLTCVFDRFYRVDKSRSREQGGTGLGLTIARSIVVAHGGTIELTSAPGQGTVFTINLPVEGTANQDGEIG